MTQKEIEELSKKLRNQNNQNIDAAQLLSVLLAKDKMSGQSNISWFTVILPIIFSKIILFLQFIGFLIFALSIIYFTLKDVI